MKLKIRELFSQRFFSELIITLMFLYVLSSASANIPFLFKFSFFLLFFFYSIETNEITGQSEKNKWKVTKKNINWKQFFTIIGIFTCLILLIFYILWKL